MKKKNNLLYISLLFLLIPNFIQAAAAGAAESTTSPVVYSFRLVFDEKTHIFRYRDIEVTFTPKKYGKRNAICYSVSFPSVYSPTSLETIQTNNQLGLSFYLKHLLPLFTAKFEEIAAKENLVFP